MPGGNGTGPLGMGPMTGRGAGYCAGFNVPGCVSSIGGRGMGMRFGRGRGMGRGRGFGRGFGFYGAPGAYPVNAPVGATQELEGLKQQAEFLQDSLSQINERIEQLEKESNK